ncbi:MAG TPA: RecX family transcriptional regulator [Gaiella sp.]|nr:RecX family transcriptional regulator [Gaiella sp.]
MPTVTALKERRGSVAIELDGAPWRTVPVAVAAESRLTLGCELDRERARSIGRALRRHRARDAAVRAVARRDHSRASLDARLERAGVRLRERGDAIDAATRAGLVDDARFAEARAKALADRGAGDLLVLGDLERNGVDDATAYAALATLEPEAVRASGIVASRGATARTLRYLAARGFSEDSLEGLVADLESRALG